MRSAALGKLAVVAMIICLAASTTFGAVVPMTVQDLTEEAPTIIIGNVVAVDSYWETNDLGEMIVSDVEIAVTDYLKGTGEQTLTLTLWGGTVDELSMFTSILPTFEVNDHVLLFLNGAQVNGLVGAFQGAYLTDGITAVQMHGGMQRMDEDFSRPFFELLSEIELYLDEPLPGGVSQYDGPLNLTDKRSASYTLTGCSWSYANPMQETYRINPNCFDSGCGTDEQIRDAVIKGTTVWGNAGADFFFNYYGPTASAVVTFNSQNIIFWDNDGSEGMPSPTIAATFYWCSGSSLTEWDMAFNDPFYNFWDGATGSCGGFRYDIQSVAAHECGHALGLGHSPISVATMYASTGPCNLGPRTLYSDDINGDVFLYDTATSPLPFSDDFPSTTPNGAQWIGIDGVSANSSGINEPSPPYSLNLDGDANDGGNSITTNFFDLGGMSGVKLSYWYQRTGGGDSPEPGDNLIVEYSNTFGQWSQLNSHPGDGPDMTDFEHVLLDLPSGVHHDDVHFRFRVISNESGQDDWFIDNVDVTSVLTYDFPVETIGGGDLEFRTIDVTPTDNNGISSIQIAPAVPFAGLNYDEDTIVTLSTDDTALGGFVFFKEWLLDGSPAGNDPSNLSFPATDGVTITAGYQMADLVFVDSAPVQGVTITNDPVDLINSMEVTTPGLLLYFDETVTLTAPTSADGYDFSHWTINDVDQPDGVNVVDVSSSPTAQAVANYTPVVDCAEDTNGDNVVDIIDLLALLAAWGTDDAATDVNADGIVNVEDLLQMLGAWGPCS